MAWLAQSVRRSRSLWTHGPSQGREGLYVSGAYDGKFLIYEPRGLQRLFTAALVPTDARVMEKSRHPVTDVGIGRLLEIVGTDEEDKARARGRFVFYRKRGYEINVNAIREG